MSDPTQSAGEAEDGSIEGGEFGPRNRSEDRQPHDSDVLESQMPDLTGVPLNELRVSGDSAIAHALRRLADDLSGADEFVAGFQSAI